MGKMNINESIMIITILLATEHLLKSLYFRHKMQDQGSREFVLDQLYQLPNS